MEYKHHLPPPPYKRIVIIGAGFGGLQLAKRLRKSRYQVVLIDKNNYHQFQPLFYQVATSGLEPSSISFPLRKIFQKQKNIHIRMAEVLSVMPEEHCLQTTIGTIEYDYLVIATGCDTNFYGNQKIIEHAMPMKTVGEALALRNHILRNFENRINTSGDDEQYLNLVITGGGATGVEVAGTLAEMKTHVLPKDYPEMDFSKLKIFLLEGNNRLLGSFHEKLSQKALQYLDELGVTIKLGVMVTDYDGTTIQLSDGTRIVSNTLIWAAGVTGNVINGISSHSVVRGNRYKVNPYNMVEGYDNIFAIGDICFMVETDFPNGHPQVAQVAIQQGKNLARNFRRMESGKPPESFSYRDLGSMATIGRHKAVVEIEHIRTYGFVAWFVWMFVHLMALVGVKNKVIIFINWLWHYITYDQSLRLILTPKSRKKEPKE